MPVAVFITILAFVVLSLFTWLSKLWSLFGFAGSGDVLPTKIKDQSCPKLCYDDLLND